MSPKILFVDIETFPDRVWAWSVYDANAIAVDKHWQVASYSAKWLGGKHITRGLCDCPGYAAGGDDYSLILELWKLLNEADIVVAHNGVDFDIKKMNARFIAHGMKPPSPYKVVDTKRAVKQVAAFSSNKLDWLCKQLEIGRKIEHEGFELWLKCMDGDEKAWATMKKYNHHDVELLEELYEALAPWIKQPNGASWSKSGICCVNPACMSKHIQWRGKAKNKTIQYDRFQCQKCGKWGRAVRKGERIAEVVGID